MYQQLVKYLQDNSEEQELENGDYIAAARLDDGTQVNEVTIWTGPGLACDTEIEASRPLTPEELDAALDFFSSHDVSKLPAIEIERFDLRERF